MSYKIYQEYKNSNNIWAGDVPTHWELHKIKNLIFFQEGPGLRNWQFTDNGVRVICVTNITSNGIDFSNYEKFISEDEYKQIYSHFTVNQGDLLLSSSGNSWGKVAEYNSDETVILNTSTIRINKNPTSDYELEQPYIKWALQSEYIREQLGLMMTGSCQPNFGPTHLAKISILMPSIEEQQQIANYLDKKTAKIDATIARNEELIQLLEEKRVALINQVVTKGLNPDVPMKDSGIEWIGEIPEHWKTNKIKNMSYVKGRIGWHGLTSEEYADEGAYLVTGTDFAEGTVDWNHCNHINYERYKQDPNIHLKEGDLLITKDGTIGKLALIKNIPDKATLNSGIFLVRPLKDNYTNDYLYWVLSSDIFARFFDYIKTGATIAHLYQETFERFFFPYMSLDEQEQIVNYLTDNVAKIDLTIKKVEETIKLLEEYKTSLIHHVVTGKIDVRGEEI